ncbi:glutamate racemase [Pedobacter montanisoli]|uniref:Glutamate racemase n=1 Tax=Pedobacter montanisoli TaxID=2923277 RepID=A0ABS9ZX58_9SPHI|nr:glutamate racemase [Pedobacter montanisoli]MCJ0742875.1 glutamate racemase [Pedobacter montanisoli]
MERKFSIGVFDSGYGGLTVLKSIIETLPDYNYIYLGDNARSPYGDHSFETVYHYTLQSVEWLFNKGCKLVILACNTASAKALRNIQQLVLPEKYPGHRVLGVIRPTAEIIGDFTQTQKVGVLGTRGTVRSNSYPIEISHFFPDVEVFQQSCPLWVPLVENNEHLNEGADYFVKKYLDELFVQSKDIDTLLLACTHYPLMISKIAEYIPEQVKIVAQADIVAQSLLNYLYRHPEIENELLQNQKRVFYTSGDTENFDQHAAIFLEQAITSLKMEW